jgi:hypothetical protein
MPPTGDRSVDLRLLAKDDLGRYQVGPRVSELHSAAGADRLRSVALPSCDGCVMPPVESAQIYRRQGGSSACVWPVWSPPPACGTRCRKGALLTMAAGSAAQVLSAWSGNRPQDFSEQALAEVRRRWLGTQRGGTGSRRGQRLGARVVGRPGGRRGEHLGTDRPHHPPTRHTLRPGRGRCRRRGATGSESVNPVTDQAVTDAWTRPDTR